MENTGVKLKAAGGSPLVVKGEVHTKVIVGDSEMEANLIVAGILEEMILGSDYMKLI